MTMKKQKRQWLSFILVLSIFLSNLSGSVYATEQFFDDARGHWAENVIYRFAEQGIVHGYPDGSLQPEGQSTRAEAFSILDRLRKINESVENVDDGLEDEFKESELSSKKGSSHVPSPQYSFEIPKEIYVDEEITIVPKSRYVKSVTWTMTHENLPVEVDSVIEGDLTNDGGKITFKSMGIYTLTARAVNRRGRTVTHDQTISVYPNIRLHLDLMEHAHTDTSVIVDLITEGLGEKEVEWILQCDDRDIKLDEFISGELSNQGGVIQFKEPGTYELIASVEDDLGKIITASDTITIYPVATIQLEMESITQTSHLDKCI